MAESHVYADSRLEADYSNLSHAALVCKDLEDHHLHEKPRQCGRVIRDRCYRNLNNTLCEGKSGVLKRAKSFSVKLPDLCSAVEDSPRGLKVSDNCIPGELRGYSPDQGRDSKSHVKQTQVSALPALLCFPSYQAKLIQNTALFSSSGAA